MLKLLVIGNLTKDATTNKVGDKTVINFTVAHNEKYKDAQGIQQSKGIFVDCAWWTDKIAIVPYLKKGTQIYAEGKPEVKSYTTQDGINGATQICTVIGVQLLDSKQTDVAQMDPTQSAAPKQAATNNMPSNNPDDGNLPF